MVPSLHVSLQYSLAHSCLPSLHSHALILTGALFSFVSAIQVLASVCGYVLYPTIYYHTITLNWYHSPGISFFVMAILYIFAIPFML